jgi:hypothetical protein
LFECYDAVFCEGKIRESLGTTPLTFTLSQRMTRTGGTTTRTRRPGKSHRYEIRISVPVLYSCFLQDDHRTVTVGGRVCRSRLEALQRVMEHELVHLLEWMLWNSSSCSRGRYQSIVLRLFGHTESKHQLITPVERVAACYGIRPGDRVRFRFENTDFTGVVNRITRRATVLVEDPDGEPYSNGKHYRKFYVPADVLEKDEPPVAQFRNSKGRVRSGEAR